MKSNRRTFLRMGLGAMQLSLLEALSSSRARAVVPGEGPTKLMTIYVPGGVHWEHFFCPFMPDSIAAHMGRVNPYPFYDADQVENFDGSGQVGANEAVRPVRGPIWWNWDEPSAWRGGYDNKGYAWASSEHRIFENTAIIHGVDQQTAAHQSGVIASVCGVAGSTFAAPSLHAHVANFFADYFPERIVPSVVVGNGVRAPQVGLPAAVAPSHLGRVADAQWQLSDRGDHWTGLRTRTALSIPTFDDGAAMDMELTAPERYALWSTRRQRTRGASSGTDRRLQDLYENYAAVSHTVASDVLARLETTQAFEYWGDGGPDWTRPGLLGWRQGLADDGNDGGDYRRDFGTALQFLKSGLTTSVAVRVNDSFDFHNGSLESYHRHGYAFHGVMETLGQVLIEMKNTPTGAGRTLLDDTLVYIYSDFGRSFNGDDHNPMTSSVLVGGGIRGNQMFGGYSGAPLGMPVAITEEDGSSVNRPPKSQDTIATALSAFGMRPGEGSFFLPGGYGVIEGIVPT